jgi:gamma-carbonic anhydrase
LENNFRSIPPDIHPSVYVDPTARIVGDVRIGADASVWCNTTIRGDMNTIVIGARSNIQDNSVLHSSLGKTPLVIGADVLIGHRAIIHGCTIRGPALIGMGAIIMDGCVIEEDVIVGAGALLTEGKVVPRGHLAMGSPARVVRPLGEKEIEYVRWVWKDYYDLVQDYLRQGAFHGWGANRGGSF